MLHRAAITLIGVMVLDATLNSVEVDTTWIAGKLIHHINNKEDARHRPATAVTAVLATIPDTEGHSWPLHQIVQ